MTSPALIFVPHKFKTLEEDESIDDGEVESHRSSVLDETDVDDDEDEGTYCTILETDSNRQSISRLQAANC